MTSPFEATVRQISEAASRPCPVLAMAAAAEEAARRAVPDIEAQRRLIALLVQMVREAK